MIEHNLNIQFIEYPHDAKITRNGYYSFSFIVGNSSDFYRNTVFGEIVNIQLHALKYA